MYGFFLFTSYLHIDCIVGNPTLDRDTVAAAVENAQTPQHMLYGGSGASGNGNGRWQLESGRLRLMKRPNAIHQWLVAKDKTRG